MIGLNLLPDVKKEFIKAQRTRNTVISVAIIAMLISGGVTTALALFVYVGQNAAMGLQNASIADNQKKLEAKPEISKYLTIQNQLDALATLHDKDHKAIYSRLFDYVIKLNPAAPYSVSLGSAKIAKDGTTLSLQGSTKDFKSLDVFKNTLEKAKLTYKLDSQTQDAQLFSTVTLKSAALSDTSGKTIVAFEFDLVYAVEAFRPDITEVQLVVPKQTISNAEDNAPTELFSTQGGTQ